MEATTQPAHRLRRCCRCNRSAKCLRCACARAEVRCSSCLPGDAGNCHNRQPRSTASSSASSSQATAPNEPSSSPSPVSTASGAPLQPPASSEPASSPTTPVSPAALPSLSTIQGAYVPTLQHVPKGARDCWAKALSDCLSAIVGTPADLSLWSRLFMLAKCVLASPSAGHRLRGSCKVSPPKVV